ncbi:hypothetical protein L484_003835 [Morus notabilis]|uniref:Uncharacterized protein n=1 Tax=Morus notabilis TaxID=981085 RepID=W9RCA2_9ROSA|nr:hypothetical protein L484_003835 [Morus notabilis]
MFRRDTAIDCGDRYGVRRRRQGRCTTAVIATVYSGGDNDGVRRRRQRRCTATAKAMVYGGGDNDGSGGGALHCRRKWWFYEQWHDGLEGSSDEAFPVRVDGKVHLGFVPLVALILFPANSDEVRGCTTRQRTQLIESFPMTWEVSKSDVGIPTVVGGRA